MLGFISCLMFVLKPVIIAMIKKNIYLFIYYWRLLESQIHLKKGLTSFCSKTMYIISNNREVSWNYKNITILL